MFNNIMMDAHSQETLRRIEQNDATLTKLRIGYNYDLQQLETGRTCWFNSRDSDDFSRLGSSIKENTHLTDLFVLLNGNGVGVHDNTAFTRSPGAIGLDLTNEEFYEGVKQNSSFQRLELDCNDRTRDFVGGVGHEILNAYRYQAKNRKLTRLLVSRTSLANGGDDVLAAFLRSCTNLREISLINSNITDEQLLPMVEAVRGQGIIEELHLGGNRIGNTGCEVLATLLEDPNSNLHTLDLCQEGNHIGNVGATTLVNSLSNNTKLRKLNLDNNPIDRSVRNTFSKLLCNKSSINSIYLSNHTLEELYLPQLSQLAYLSDLNKNRNKSHVAMIKILQYNRNIDMEPFFEWNTEGEGERDLKALPYIVAWFDKAGEMAAREGIQCYHVDRRKLSAIYQFATSMPFLFVPASHVKVEGKKRKRDIK